MDQLLTQIAANGSLVIAVSDLSNTALRTDAPDMALRLLLTIRLSPDQPEEIETVASIDDQPLSEVMRAAIADHIENRKRDASFKDGLKGRIERAQRMLEDESV